MNDLDRRIVAVDLFVALSNVAVGGMLSTVAFAPALRWLVPPLAVGIALLTAAADRSQRGVWLLTGFAVLVTVGIGWGMVTDRISLGILPVLLLCLGIGSAANRVLFGVYYPVPDVRRRRERDGSVGD
ncbi:MAG: hypothetical protein ABEI98_10765 [Halorhabdus sp.]